MQRSKQSDKSCCREKFENSDSTISIACDEAIKYYFVFVSVTKSQTYNTYRWKMQCIKQITLLP
jgi:hypothetical protein